MRPFSWAKLSDAFRLQRKFQRYVAVGASAVDISGAVLEGSDSAAGTVTLAVTLSGAVLEGSDAVAGTVAVAVSISGAIAEGSDVAAGTLTVAVSISGAIQEGSDAAAGTLDVEAGAAVDISGDVLEGSDTADGNVDAVESSTLLTGGSGYPVDWQGKRRKPTLADRPNEHLRQILDRVVSEYYGEIVASDAPQAVKAEAGKLVKPFADKKGRYKAVPKPAEVDWVALQRDADAVSAILRIWSEEVSQNDIEDDDTEFFMLMS